MGQLRGIRPLDTETILGSVRKTGRVVLTHEAPKPGGPGSEVAAIIAEEAIEYLEAPIRRVAAPDVPIPQSAYLEQYIVPSVDELVESVKELV